ncbi:MAG TPA: hypothetical protein VN969_31685 [Streptosporangiaceae bacterium]|nr:hypothetical protein [Streptosporangiaceae bacterium]
MALLTGSAQEPGTTVSDLHMVYLRGQISGEEGVMREALRRLAGPQAMDGLLPLIYEAFVIAVQQKFGPAFTRSQVIRLVAQVRAVLGEGAELVDPVTAEAEVLLALGQRVPASADGTVRAAAQMAVLDVIVRDLDLDEDAIATLLNQARQNTGRRAVSAQPTE